ncbi:MAG: hypothetical protein AB7E46_15080 [Desulfovibrio sp.]
MAGSSCASCEHHKSKSNPTPGKLVPGQSGKCTRPEGPCKDDKMNEINTPQIEEVHTEPIPEITPARALELANIQNTAAVADQATMQYGAVYKAIGRIEGMDFLRRVGDVAIAQAFIEVRSSKQYKGFPYKDEAGNLRHVEDFDEFCKVAFGKSYTRCYELSKNLHLLGSDLYESAERIGFRAKDYRALQALPPEEQEVVKQALESESREQVLDILQDMAARHALEKAASKKEAAELKADAEAKDKVLQAKQQRLDKAELELEKLKSLGMEDNVQRRLEIEGSAVRKLNELHVAALAEMNKFFGYVETMRDTAGMSTHTASYAVQIAHALCEDISGALLEHNIPVDFEEIVNPQWLRSAAKDDLIRGNIGEGGVR